MVVGAIGELGSVKLVAEHHLFSTGPAFATFPLRLTVARTVSGTGWRRRKRSANLAPPALVQTEVVHARTGRLVATVTLATSTPPG
jgi:hypothetical protein